MPKSGFLAAALPIGRHLEGEPVKSNCKVVLQIVLFVGTLVSAMQSSARGTEITFLCAAALESWMVEIIPEFQKTSGYNVKPTFQIINDITERVRKGDAADLATVSILQWEDLQRQRKLNPDVRVVIAQGRLWRIREKRSC
jgi:ABC-type molybdate transport system substrate-binding protein